MSNWPQIAGIVYRGSESGLQLPKNCSLPAKCCSASGETYFSFLISWWHRECFTLFIFLWETSPSRLVAVPKEAASGLGRARPKSQKCSGRVTTPFLWCLSKRGDKEDCPCCLLLPLRIWVSAVLGIYLCCSKGTSQSNTETTKQLTESQIMFKLMSIGHDIKPQVHFMCKSWVFLKDKAF